MYTVTYNKRVKKIIKVHEEAFKVLAQSTTHAIVINPFQESGLFLLPDGAIILAFSKVKIPQPHP